MDTNTLSTIVIATYSTLQPYLPILATKAAEKIGTEVPAGIAKLWQSLHEHFARRPPAQEILRDLTANPNDPDLQAAFRVQLKKLLAEDGKFAGELQRLISDAGTNISYQANVYGSGAIAQGPGAKAVGAGSTVTDAELKKNKDNG